MTFRSRSRSGALRAAVLVGAAATLVAMLLMTGGTTHHSAVGDTPLGGSQGTDASLPLTPSAMTVSGRGAFSDLQVTVNQTADLVNQAVSVTWKGLTPQQATFTNLNNLGFTGSYNGNYLQVMECWGADDGEVPSNPGPPPQQCEFGGQNKNAAAYPANASLTWTRITAKPLWTCGTGAPNGCASYSQLQQTAASDAAKASQDPTYSPSAYQDPASGFIYSPFRAVDGTEINESVDSACCIGPPPWPAFDTNPDFNYTTTNEIDFARTFPDGTGQQLFAVDTGEQAPGLGCGQAVEPAADGSTSVPPCWLVIVPRGTPAKENPLGDGINQSVEVDSSPLTPWAWANRIAVPLQFNPIGTSCPLGGSVRRIVGSELAAQASASWQPTLCGVSGNPPYSYASLSDDSARAQLTGAVPGGAGMAVMSNPIDPSLTDPANPVVYAPLTLSGVTIGFNIQRQPAEGPGGAPYPDELALAGKQVVNIQLTPRLVAKLLTESYRNQFLGPESTWPPGYSAWLGKNPGGLVEDPDFVQFNPEFVELATSENVDDSGLVVEQPAADALGALWQWILSDPEAKAWLSGQPDPFGMTVNPNYNLTNPTSALYGLSAIDQVKKADPYCYQSGIMVGNPSVLARPLCMQDWTPYVNTMHDAASATRNANSNAATEPNLGATSASTAWLKNGPQVIGEHFILSITDTADAARFGLQAAGLSRAGDDGATRTFVTPTSASLLAGEQAMTASPVAGVKLTNPSPTDTSAYPLTMLTYAAVMPTALDQTARHDYAAFISYAVGAGQQPGFAYGMLPEGYVSLPSDLVSEATTAVATILNPPTTTTTTTTTTTAPTTTTIHATTTTRAPTTTRSAVVTATTRATAPPVASPAASPAVQTQPQSFSPTPVPATTSTSAPRQVTPAPPSGPVVTGPALKTTTARSPHTPVGDIRLALPIALLIGLLAGGGALVIALPHAVGQ